MIRPKVIVFLNAFRDQLDRYGEVDVVVSKWWRTLEKIDWKPQVLVSGNDNNTVKLASLEGINASIFKIHGQISWGEGVEVEHDLIKGDIEAKIEKDRGMEGIDLSVDLGGEKLKFSLPIPGIYHVSDFLAALSVYYYLNLPLEHISGVLKDYSPAFGRVEKIKLEGRDGYIFLIKNPAGASLVFETINPQLKTTDRIFMALNDNFADGTDVSWIWDAEFEKLVKSQDIEIIVSGTRAYDLATRLKYAGVKVEKLIIETDLKKALKAGLKDLTGRLFLMPTYTALLELQKIMADLGYKRPYWKED